MRPLYFIKKAVAGMRNALLVNILAIVTIALSLTILSVFLSGIITANRMAGVWESHLEVVAYLKEGVPTESITGLEEKIKAFPEVQDVGYISKDDALVSLERELAGDSPLIEGLDGNPLPASFVIRLKEGFQDQEGVKMVAGRLMLLDPIEDMQYGGEWMERFSALILMIKFGGAALGVGLAVSTMLIISGTIRLTFQTRMDEIEIMRLVGATGLFIKVPFIIEGLLQGVIGAAISMAIMTAARGLIEANFGNEMRLLFGGDISFIPYQAVIGIFPLGIFFGLIGSIISLWRFPRA